MKITARGPGTAQGFDLKIDVPEGIETVLFNVEPPENTQSSSLLSMAQGAIQYAWDHKEVIAGGVVTAATGIAYAALKLQLEGLHK
jgi:hypothetical protein